MAGHALDYGSQGGRVPTDMGYALVCNQCALGNEPPHFTYFHGYYVWGNNDKVRSDLRAIGANYSSRGKVLCPYCSSYDKYEVHEGFFRLWRSVKLPASQHAAAWAAVDRTDWVAADSQELVAKAAVLRDGPRLPTMMARRRRRDRRLRAHVGGRALGGARGGDRAERGGLVGLLALLRSGPSAAGSLGQQRGAARGRGAPRAPRGGGPAPGDDGGRVAADRL